MIPSYRPRSMAVKHAPGRERNETRENVRSEWHVTSRTKQPNGVAVKLSWPSAIRGRMKYRMLVKLDTRGISNQIRRKSPSAAPICSSQTPGLAFPGGEHASAMTSASKCSSERALALAHRTSSAVGLSAASSSAVTTRICRPFDRRHRRETPDPSDLRIRAQQVLQTDLEVALGELPAPAPQLLVVDAAPLQGPLPFHRPLPTGSHTRWTNNRGPVTRNAPTKRTVASCTAKPSRL